MKKRLLLSMMGTLLLLLLSACQGSRSLLEKISDTLSVDVSSGTIVTSSDSHIEISSSQRDAAFSLIADSPRFPALANSITCIFRHVLPPVRK